MHEVFEGKTFEGHTMLKILERLHQDVIFSQVGCGDIGCFNGHPKEMLPHYLDKNHLTQLGADLLFGSYVSKTLST